MKCQNCGKPEVSFHYSSSINGCVTETHLCADCAAKSGYDYGSVFDTGSIIEGLFPLFAGRKKFVPTAMPVSVMGVIPAMPFFARQHTGIAGRVTGQSGECNCCGENTTTDETVVKVDEKLKERRELNMQMRTAVENEEFEKAAELRDRLKDLQ